MDANFKSAPFEVWEWISKINNRYENFIHAGVKFSQC